jgi:NAD(P)-dependent dehydrogenase (short-subunit alcohol dehydrogenase family)
VAAPFADRVALITGGASGIGAALARALVADGARVILADVDAEGAAARVQELGPEHARAVHLDVRDRAAVAAVVEEVVAVEGRIDLLFNNAGIAVIGNVLAMTPDHWDALVDVNIRGVHHGIEAVYPVMVRQGHGHIVNTASAAGLLPTPGFTAYAMTKHAVVGLSVSLRYEAERYGVKVSAVCPGVIDTNMAETARVLGAETRLKETQPDATRHLATPDACARAILKGVRRNRAIIPVTAMAHVGWRLYRLWAGLIAPIARRGRDLLAPR